MAYSKPVGPDITSVEIVVLKEEAVGKDAKFVKRIRVVEWQTDKGNYRMLEKREFTRMPGKEMMGKAKGFSLVDMEFVYANREAILAALQPGYAVPIEAPVQEEAPF